MIEDIDEDGNDILREHKYPKLISKALFDKCKNAKNGRGHNRYKRTYEDYTFTGLINVFNAGVVIALIPKKESMFT